MGYRFNIKNYYKVKKEGQYPWPCKGYADRTIELFNDDVLTKDSEDGTFMKHTGLGCVGIILKDDEVYYVPETARLQMI